MYLYVINIKQLTIICFHWYIIYKKSILMGDIPQKGDLPQQIQRLSDGEKCYTS